MIEIGQLAGNYRITRLLGEGGMGVVFEAVHEQIGKKAAIKVLHSNLSQNQSVASRFQNEARAASIIEHSGIVEIFEFGYLRDGSAYIVMELLKGEPLSRRLSRGGMNYSDVLRLGRQTASVLAAAHAKGIVHRDLKPDNVFIVPEPEAAGGERAKVLDFGIAKLAEAYRTHGQRTVDGELLGTPTYMAPEQCRGVANLSDRADVYALGIMFYEMLAGHAPFTSENVGELIVLHVTAPPMPLSQAAPSVPGAMVELVHAMIAKQPAERPSMVQVVDTLEALGAGCTTAMIASEFSVMDQPTLHAQEAPRNQHPAHLTPHQGAEPLMRLAPKTGSPARRKDQLRLLVSSVVSVAAIGVGAGLVLSDKGTQAPPLERPTEDGPPGRAPVLVQDAATQDAAIPDAAVQRRPAPPTPPPGMAYLAGGTFAMGSTAAEVQAAFELCEKIGTDCRKEIYEREQPVRQIELSPFFIDRTEITNLQFADWLGEQRFLVKERVVRDGVTIIANLHPEHGRIDYKGGRFVVRPGATDAAVVQVTWAGAARYCEAQGKQLPSEAQWELAARGRADRRFPWGAEEPRCDGVVVARGPGGACAKLGPGAAAVGTSPQDRTPEGVSDLGGNVSEWVLDRFVERYPACGDRCRDPVVDGGEAGGAQRVVRGGSWGLPADASRAAGRSRSNGDRVQINVGFRCVQLVKEE